MSSPRYTTRPSRTRSAASSWPSMAARMGRSDPPREKPDRARCVAVRRGDARILGQRASRRDPSRSASRKSCTAANISDGDPIPISTARRPNSPLPSRRGSNPPRASSSATAAMAASGLRRSSRCPSRPARRASCAFSKAPRQPSRRTAAGGVHDALRALVLRSTDASSINHFSRACPTG